MDLVAAGQAGLNGWRGKLADRVAEPVSSKTPLSADQVRAIVGGIFLLLAILTFVRTLRRAWRAATA
jgi:hypothetical protein